MANQNTGADIQQAQNSPENLRLLAAQRQMYLDEKLLVVLQVFLALSNAVLGSLIALSATLALYVLFAGFVVSFINEAIGFLIGNKQKQAARIQEQFDCSVLQLPWHKLTAGYPEPPENIEAASRRYQMNKQSTLRDWYIGTLENLPFEAARVLCQRTNCAYDIALREKYLSGLSMVVVVAVAIVCFVGFFGSMSVQDWILKLVGPLLPGFSLFMRQRQAHLESIKRLGELRVHADGLWKLTTERKGSSKRLCEESRALQNAIFHHRSKSAVEFEWLYNRFRSQLEREQGASNDHLIEQYQKVVAIQVTR